MSTTTKSPKTTDKPKSAAEEKKPRAAPTHPKYEEMITEAIEKTGDKSGASRPAIKKYLLKTYKLTDGAAFNSNVSHAITRGHERGVFDLPKGFGGKVQIGSEKENETPSPPSKKRSTQTVLGSKKAAPTKRKAPSDRKPAVKPTARVAAAAKAAAAEEKKQAASRKAAAQKESKPSVKKAAKKPAAKVAASKAPAAKKVAAKKPEQKLTVAKKSVPRKAPTDRSKPAKPKAAARTTKSRK